MKIIPTWQAGFTALSLLGITAHCFLRYCTTTDFYGLPLSDLPLLFVIATGGTALVIHTAHKLLRGRLSADLLAAIALITGTYVGEYLAATLIILMLAGGETLETYAITKASSVLYLLSRRMSALAHRETHGTITDIAIQEINVGDIIVIYPHETCPVDGTVKHGHSTMDESYLTGEPYVISKAPGSSVLSGAVNGASALTIIAEKRPEDSRYATIMKVMSEAEQQRPSIRRLGDQLGALFAPFALIVALLTWYVSGDATRFLAVLMIATPCPLLIAIPITVISAISQAAKRGIIIKDPTVLERLPTCRTAIFDKTGTLTYGEPSLTEHLTAPGWDAAYVLTRTASLERYSKHPLASAIMAYAEKTQLTLLEATHVTEKPGEGLQGTVAGEEIRIVGRNIIAERFPHLLSALPETASGLECIVLISGAYAATLRFRDTPRKASRSFIGHLAPSHHFDRILIVSGDREKEVRALAERLQITETYAEQSPEQKLAIVRHETKQRPTLYMGDGINDAPALTAATVGIAFGHHSSITAAAAGAVILESTFLKVDELMHLGLNMRRIALQSGIGGIVLSIFGMAAASAGLVTPVAGALLQEVIDVLAIVNALRLAWQPHIATDMQR